MTDPLLPDIRFEQYAPEKEPIYLDTIRKLMEQELSEPYSIYVYHYFLHQWPELCFMAVDNEDATLRGVVVCKLEPHRSGTYRGYIAMLATQVEHRGRGIATKLVRKAIEAMDQRNADEVVLETEVTNEASLQLYRRLGFIRLKRLHRYYLNGNNAFRLVRQLDRRADDPSVQLNADPYPFPVRMNTDDFRVLRQNYIPLATLFYRLGPRAMAQVMHKLDLLALHQFCPWVAKNTPFDKPWTAFTLDLIVSILWPMLAKCSRLALTEQTLPDVVEVCGAFLAYAVPTFSNTLSMTKYASAEVNGPTLWNLNFKMVHGVLVLEHCVERLSDWPKSPEQHHILSSALYYLNVTRRDFHMFYVELVERKLDVPPNFDCLAMVQEGESGQKRKKTQSMIRREKKKAKKAERAAAEALIALAESGGAEAMEGVGDEDEQNAESEQGGAETDSMEANPEDKKCTVL